jgi:ADP-heptose:LPS heptosyltransferase
VEFLGVPPQGDHLEFPLRDDDYQALHDIPEAQQLQPGSYVCVHPGARAADRRWPPDRFAAVADVLAARGLPVVLTGAAEEAHLTAATAHAMTTPPLDLTGQTSLGALAALLKGARVVVCNDTGVAHLATALDVPSVVIFSASEMHRWAPPNHERHRAVSARAGATPADVLAQAEELLHKEDAHAV